MIRSRRLSPPLVCAAFIAGTHLVASDVVTAQETVSGDRLPASAAISGFRGLPWGSQRSEIVDRMGTPIEERHLDMGLDMMAWRGELAGQPSILLLGSLEGEGLVKAQEIVDLEATGLAGEECIEFVRAIHKGVDLQFPLIRPAEQAKNNTPDAICEAAAAGMAFWHRQWRDEETGSVVTVGLASGSRQVELTYESLAFRDWIAADGATPLIDGNDTSESIEAVGTP